VIAAGSSSVGAATAEVGAVCALAEWQARDMLWG